MIYGFSIGVICKSDLDIQDSEDLTGFNSMLGLDYVIVQLLHF